MTFPNRTFIFLSLLISLSALRGVAADNPFFGAWELTIPGGAAGWLGVEEKDGALRASLLWGGGSVLPLDTAKVESDRLVLTRKSEVDRKGGSGKKKRETLVETITATMKGDQLELVSVKQDAGGQTREKTEPFYGRRQPPMPPTPCSKWTFSWTASGFRR